MFVINIAELLDEHIVKKKGVDAKRVGLKSASETKLASAVVPLAQW